MARAINQPIAHQNAAQYYRLCLLTGVQIVAASLRDAIGRIDVAPAIPRAGLARRLATNVARGFGTRRVRRRLLDGLAGLLEAYNEELYRLEPMPDATARRIARSVLDLWSALQRLAHTKSMADRISTLGARALAMGDATVPECVLYLRACVIAGVVAGEADEAAHGALDRFAVALGLAWEAHHGELTVAGWRGGLAMLGEPCEDTSLPLGAALRAKQLATAALAPLGQPAASEGLLALFDLLAGEDAAATSRRYTQYEPMYASTTAPVVTPAFINEFAAQWRPQIDDAMRELARGPADALVHAAGYLRGQGGKRLRGLVTLAAAVASGGDCHAALPAAAAVEWLHQTSLILDDIVDDAWTRRGAPCLHRITTPQLATAASVFMLLRCGQAARALPAGVSEAMLDAKLALLKGECLEIALEPATRASLNTYYRIIEGKTASLFACAASVGALCAPDPDRRRVGALGRYGREIGLAFQIVDDLLDYTGDERMLGKQPGTDFRNGRLTLPAILLANGRALPDHADFQTTRAAIATSGIAAASHARARTHVERALDALQILPANDGRAALEQLAWAILERSA